jgi:hypothetical protein
MGVTAAALDEAPRAAEAFDGAKQRAPRRRFADCNDALLRTHVVELAGCPKKCVRDACGCPSRNRCPFASLGYFDGSQFCDRHGISAIARFWH